MAVKKVEQVVCDVCGADMPSGERAAGRGYDYCQACMNRLEAVVQRLVNPERQNARVVAALLRARAAELAPPIPRKRKRSEAA